MPQAFLPTIRGFPTFMFHFRGSVIDTIVGANMKLLFEAVVKAGQVSCCVVTLHQPVYWFDGVVVLAWIWVRPRRLHLSRKRLRCQNLENVGNQLLVRSPPMPVHLWKLWDSQDPWQRRCHSSRTPSRNRCPCLRCASIENTSVDSFMACSRSFGRLSRRSQSTSA